jgi:hypothetical protein
MTKKPFDLYVATGDMKKVNFFRKFWLISLWSNPYKHNWFIGRKDIFFERFSNESWTEDSKERKVLLKYLKDCENDSRNPRVNRLSLALRAFDSTRYDVSEIQQMRLYKSKICVRMAFVLGIFFYLVKLVAIAANGSNCIATLTANFPVADYYRTYYSFISAVVLFRGAFDMWSNSLNFELKHYKVYTPSDLARLGRLIISEINRGSK